MATVSIFANITPNRHTHYYYVDVTKYKTDESAAQSGNSTDQGAQAGSADNSSNNSGNADNASSEGEQKSEGSGQPAEAS